MKYIIFYRTIESKGVYFDFDKIEIDETQDIDEICLDRYNGYKKLEYVFEVKEWPKEV